MEPERNLVLLRVCNIAAFIGTVIVNTLATTLPINGKGTGELADMYPNLFVPSGLTFSIWGIIYLLLLAFTVYQTLKGSEAVTARIGWLFVLSSAANIGWIFAWHYTFVGLSLLIMLVLLGSLIAIYLRLQTGTTGGTSSFKLNALGKWFASIPFSVYLGWITVATIANATALLVHIGWDGFGLSEQFWTVFVIGVALAITIILLMTRKDIAFSLVVVWALAGIAYKRAFQVPEREYVIIYVAIIAAALILTAIPVALLIKQKE